MTPSRGMKALLATLATLVLASPAFAQGIQPWVSDRRFQTGPGVRTGNLELHPSVAAELGFDSNFYQSAGVEPQFDVNEPIVPAWRLQVTPSLRLSSLGPQRTAESGGPPPKARVDAGLTGHFNRLFATDAADEPMLEGRNLIGGDAGLTVDLYPTRPVGTSFELSASRIAQPNNRPGYSSFDSTAAGGQFQINWRPGGGALQWSLGYRGRLTVFDERRFGLNHYDHGVHTRGRWRFLPRTSLIYDGDVGFVNYLQPGTRMRSANPITSQLGINGLVTARFGLLVMGGYRATFYRADPAGNVDDFDGVIGRVEATWFLGALPEQAAEERNVVGLSSLRLGFERDVRNSGIANFYIINRGYFDLGYFFAGVASVSLRGGVAGVDHPVPRDVGGLALTDDGLGLFETRPDLGLFGEYRITSSVALMASVAYAASLGDNRLIVNLTPFERDNLTFSRTTTFVGARWFH